jgi:arginyl-tRNA synthetase
VVEQSKDNPVFYVQYAHARAASIFRNAAAAIPGLHVAAARKGGADLAALTDPGEIDLVRQLARFPRLIESAAREREPHRVPFYLFELASAFHQQWNRGNDSPHLRFIQPDDPGLTRARLGLVAALQQVISSGLTLLGVHAPLEMR